MVSPELRTQAFRMVSPELPNSRNLPWAKA